MAFSNHPFFLLVLLFSLSSLTHGADLITKQCGNTSATTNYALQANIDSTIQDLVTNTKSTGFAISTHGSGDDAVYGTAECRGDITGEDCSSCIKAAGEEIRTLCPNTTEAQVWYQLCSFHYSTTNFVGQADTSLVGVWTSTETMADPPAFKKALQELFVLVGFAAASGERRKFGWGEIESNGVTNETITIYEMAQCTADLQGPECLHCLDAAYSGLQTSCGEMTGGYVILRSCAVRYEIQPFVFLNAAPSAAVATRSVTFANN